MLQKKKTFGKMEARIKKRFSGDEIEYFKYQLSIYGSILGCKKTDSSSVLLKKATWQKLCDKFNNVPHHTKRTVPQLVKLWDNLKSKRRRELKQEKRSRLLTGGGQEATVEEEGEQAAEDVFMEKCVKIELEDPLIDSDAQFQNDATQIETASSEMMTAAPAAPEEVVGRKRPPTSLDWIALEAEERMRQSRELHVIRLREALLREEEAQFNRERAYILLELAKKDLERN